MIKIAAIIKIANRHEICEERPLMNLQPVIPFEPIRTISPPAGSQWIAQIKWDGVRMLIYADGSRVQLINRKQNDRTKQYPEFQDSRSYCRADSFILDGEMIAFDQSKPSFHQIMRRDGIRKISNIPQAAAQIPVTYMVFDILFCDGEWVTGLPLSERQSLLERMVIPQERVQLVTNFSDGPALLEVMRTHQMEGIVYKDLTSAYGIQEKDSRWQKHKIVQDLIAVVGGVTYRDGIVNALLLGLYNGNNEFIYIGHAGTGKLKNDDWRAITEYVEPLRTVKRPFVNEPERSKDAVWILPTYTVKVEYMEVTPNGTLRHPSIQGFVEAKPSDCTIQQIV
jgi:bifunctional non-homologous end joining protein LigD